MDSGAIQPPRMPMRALLSVSRNRALRLGFGNTLIEDNKQERGGQGREQNDHQALYKTVTHWRGKGRLARPGGTQVPASCQVV